MLFSLILCCNEDTQKNQNNPYINCLSSPNKELAIKLNKSFDIFLVNNFSGSLDEMLDDLINNSGNQKFVFDQGDKALFQELDVNKFHNIAYKIEKIDSQAENLNYPQYIRSKIKKGTYKRKWEIDTNLHGEHFNCLSQVGNDKKLVNGYIDMISRVGSLSLAVLGSGLKENYVKGKDDWLVKQILIMEIHYFQLRTKFINS